MATKEFFQKLKQWSTSTLDLRGRTIKAALIERWLELTGQLRATLPAYQEAMDVRETPKTLVFVMRDSPAIARMVELGAAPWDLRDTVLRGSKVRISRKGHKFVAVPFGQSTRLIRARGGAVVERIARRLRPYPGPEAGRLPTGLTGKINPYHATDPLAALVRRVRTPSSRGSTYMTWRTISEAGRPWIHPGIRSRQYMQQVLQREAQRIAVRALERMDKEGL